MLHIPPTNCLLLTAKQEPYKKAYLLAKNIEEFSGKSLEERVKRRKNDKTEKVTGLDRRTREMIAKWNQMTALRFQTWGRHQTSPASLRGVNGQKLETITVFKNLGSVITDEGSKLEILSRIAQTTAALTKLKQFGMTEVFLSLPRYN